MALAQYVPVIVFAGATGEFLARVTLLDGILLTQENTASISYTVAQTNQQMTATPAPVTGHTNVTVPVDQAISDSLVTTDANWTADTIGYNFSWQVDVTTYPAFAVAGWYTLKFTILPDSGQPLIAAFLVQAI